MRFSFTLLMVLILAGCGWHLRGALELPAEVQEMAMDPDQPFDPFQKTLRAMLKSSGVNVVPLTDPLTKPSAAVLRITESAFTNQDLTIDAQGAVSEQLLVLTVIFSMEDAKAKQLMPQQMVRIEHKIAHDESQLLRQEAEERTLHRTMQEDAVNQILHRIIIQMKAKNA